MFIKQIFFQYVIWKKWMQIFLRSDVVAFNNTRIKSLSCRWHKNTMWLSTQICLRNTDMTNITVAWPSAVAVHMEVTQKNRGSGAQHLPSSNTWSINFLISLTYIRVSTNVFTTELILLIQRTTDETDVCSRVQINWMQRTFTDRLSSAQDLKNKRNPRLVPYVLLDERTKKSNRDSLREAIRTMIGYGYNIEPLDQEGGEFPLMQSCLSRCAEVQII